MTLAVIGGQYDKRDADAVFLENLELTTADTRRATAESVI